MTTIYLIRHGQSVKNEKSEVQGSAMDETNVLTTKGIAQIESTAKLLKDVHFDALYSSPLPRARQSGEILARILGMISVEEVDLQEKKKGTIPPMQIIDHLQAYGDWNAKTEEERWDARLVPDEESMGDVYARASSVLLKIAARHPSQTALCVTHGGLLRSVYTKLIDGSLRDMWKFDNGGYMIVEILDGVITLKEVYNLQLVTRDHYA